MAQPGSVLAWGASGRRFKSGRPDQKIQSHHSHLEGGKKQGSLIVEKIWLKSYPKGVPEEINPDQFQTIQEILNQSCLSFKNDPAFYNYGVTITYQQLDQYAEAFAAYLQQVLHLKKGDRIALMMPNVLQYPVALLGAFRAGLIVVNVNPLYTAPELIHQMKDAEVDTIVVLSNFLSTIEKALPSTSLKNIIVSDLGDLFPRPKAWAIHFILKYIKKKIPTVSFPKISFREVLRTGRKKTLQKVDVRSEDVAFLQYTGGTTGIAKGAMLTHRNMVANILQAEAWFSPVFRKEQEIIVTALPLYHIFSLTANCLFLSKIGGLNVLITDPRNVPHMISEISKFKFTVITGVNTLFLALLNNAQFAKLDFSSLKVSLGGGMAVQRPVAEKWQAVTGKPIIEAYGLTETSPCATINPPDLKVYNGTVGLPVSSTEACVFDDMYRQLPLNSPGELAIRGPQVMKGYWKNPKETQKVLIKDNWLLTGDVASINEQGYVRILERKKDMILVSGFNVYPNEIEDVLMHLSGISEAAVVGVQDDNSGEAVKAFIVKSNPRLTIEDILRFCRENLTGYKIPKYIEFCAELPKTNVGKILRRALKTESNAHL